MNELSEELWQQVFSCLLDDSARAHEHPAIRDATIFQHRGLDDWGPQTESLALDGRTGRATLAALCRTCRLFRRVAEPLLYSSVRARRPGTSSALLRTLFLRPGLCGDVRMLTVHAAAPRPFPPAPLPFTSRHGAQQQQNSHHHHHHHHHHQQEQQQQEDIAAAAARHHHHHQHHHHTRSLPSPGAGGGTSDPTAITTGSMTSVGGINNSSSRTPGPQRRQQSQPQHQHQHQQQALQIADRERSSRRSNGSGYTREDILTEAFRRGQRRHTDGSDLSERERAAAAQAEICRFLAHLSQLEVLDMVVPLCETVDVWQSYFAEPWTAAPDEEKPAGRSSKKKSRKGSRGGGDATRASRTAVREGDCEKHYFPSLREVRLRNWEAPVEAGGSNLAASISTVHRVLRHPGLETFRAYGFSWRAGDLDRDVKRPVSQPLTSASAPAVAVPPPAPQPPRAPSIRALHLMEAVVDADGLWDILRGCPQLRQLQIRWGHELWGNCEPDFSAMGAALRRHGGRLEVLDLDTEWDQAGTYPNHTSLGRLGPLRDLARLRRLRVGLVILAGRVARARDVHPHAPPLADALALHDVLPPALEQLDLYPNGTPPGIATDQLADLWAAGRHPRLHTIRLYCDDRGGGLPCWLNGSGEGDSDNDEEDNHNNNYINYNDNKKEEAGGGTEWTRERVESLGWTARTAYIYDGSRSEENACVILTRQPRAVPEPIEEKLRAMDLKEKGTTFSRKNTH